MGDVNCLRCKYRHTDNGNCTAVGGFCTAVPAAHCPLLREYLDTELTPEEVLSMKFEWCTMMDALNSIGGGYTRLRELARPTETVGWWCCRARWEIRCILLCLEESLRSRYLALFHFQIP